MKMVDARGLLCPMPVVMVQKEVKANNPDVLEVLVDDPCAVENVTRFAGSQGYTVTVTEDGADFKLSLKK
jgi:TusA-related sulfurtransferase